MSTITACGACGWPISYRPAGDGDIRWQHQVEPLKHEARPSTEAAVGRARMVDDLRWQLALRVKKGSPVDREWLEQWLDWFEGDDLIDRPARESADYQEIMHTEEARP